MHQETKEELISSGASAIGSVLKELFVYRTNMEQMEQRKEMELELARARQNTDQDGVELDSGRGQSAPAPTDQRIGDSDLQEAFADLKEREECGVCRQLLDAIEHADRRTQVKALTEYGKLAHAVETGATEQEIRTILERSDTLEDLLNQSVRA